MTKRAARLMTLAIAVMTAAVTVRGQGQPRVDGARPIDAGVSLWAEELTWMEIRDCGGNQAGMRNVAGALNTKWAAEPARVHFLPEYYDQDRWSYDYLKTLGITQINKTPGQPADARTDTRNGMHDDIYYESQIAVMDPRLIRAEQRRKARLLSLHGVAESDVPTLVEIGRKLADYRAGITAQAFRASQQTAPAKVAPALVYSAANLQEGFGR